MTTNNDRVKEMPTAYDATPVAKKRDPRGRKSSIPPFTQEELDFITERRKQGATWKDIGQAMNVDPRSFPYRLQKSGVKPLELPLID